jgi:hypothetical protein
MEKAMNEIMECDKPQVMCEEAPTITVKLARKKAKLEAELAKINEAIEIINKYPDIQKVLDTVSSISRLI